MTIAANPPHPPTDGRQLLGWAAKQDPDAKGLVISFGKKRGYPSKIVDWDDEQVKAAYRYAQGSIQAGSPDFGAGGSRGSRDRE